LFPYTLENHPAGKHGKAPMDIVRYFEVVVRIVFKIEYFSAGNTVQVMMACHVGVKPFGTAVYFNQIHYIDFSKGFNFTEQCLSAGFLAGPLDLEFIEQGILLEQLDKFGLQPVGLNHDVLIFGLKQVDFFHGLRIFFTE